MRSALYPLAVVSWLVAGSAAAQTSEVQLSFETLDANVQQVNVDEIWRVRAASTRDEPAGTVVINYAYERLFVKEPLDDVIAKIRLQRDIKQFTLPTGAPVYIVASKIIGINRPIPQQDHENSKSVIVVREGRQQVRETRESVREALAK